MRDLEHEARTRSNTLEAQGKLPAGYAAHHYPLNKTEQRELQRYRLAGLLASDASTYVALSHEGRAPRRWLDRRLRELGYR